MVEQSEHTRHLRLGCILLRLECVPSEIQVANEVIIHKAFKGHLGLEGLERILINHSAQLVHTSISCYTSI